MKKRSIYQLRADLLKINLGSKSLKQAMKIVMQQYIKQGRVIPKKLQEERATKRDMQNYMNTLLNQLNKRIEKREAHTDTKFQKLLNELNNVQKARYQSMASQLEGYDSSFVKEFLNGKIAVLGRGITTSVVNTKPFTTERILKQADFNHVSPIVYLQQEIKAFKKDLQDFKNDNPKEYIIDELQKIMSEAGYTLSDKNLKDIKFKLKSVDWLGSVKLIKSIEEKSGRLMYEKYLGYWDLDDNRVLMDTIFDDISRAKHNRMIQYTRLID